MGDSGATPAEKFEVYKAFYFVQPTNKIKYGSFLNPFKSLSDNLHIPFSAQWTLVGVPEVRSLQSPGNIFSDPRPHFRHRPTFRPRSNFRPRPQHTPNLQSETFAQTQIKRLFYTMDPCRGLRGPTPSITWKYIFRPQTTLHTQTHLQTQIKLET